MSDCTRPFSCACLTGEDAFTCDYSKAYKRRQKLAIKIIEELNQPDVYLTKSEEEVFRSDYRLAYRMYSGTPPSFEQYCRMRKTQVKRG